MFLYNQVRDTFVRCKHEGDVKICMYHIFNPIHNTMMVKLFDNHHYRHCGYIYSFGTRWKNRKTIYLKSWLHDRWWIVAWNVIITTTTTINCWRNIIIRYSFRIEQQPNVNWIISSAADTNTTWEWWDHEVNKTKNLCCFCFYCCCCCCNNLKTSKTVDLLNEWMNE